MPSRLMDPSYWRKRAEEARAQAAQMNASGAKAMLLNIAESYEKIAQSQEVLIRTTRPEG